MEDGDSDTDKYPHRTGNIAEHNQLHGTWTVLFLTKRAGGKISFGFFLFSRKCVNQMPTGPCHERTARTFLL